MKQPRTKGLAAERALRELFEAKSDFLLQYPWEWEGDRWLELLICLVKADLDVEPSVVRSAVALLDELDAVSLENLVNLDVDDLALIRTVLLRSGFNTEAADRAGQLMCAAARLVTTRWTGHVQKFLREHGEKMRKQLAKTLKRIGITAAAADKAAVLWLQNVANLPILLPEDAHILSFCRRHKLSETELVDLADRLGMNLAVLDDLLAMAAADAASDEPAGNARRRN
jgi:hypothetical protein